MVLATGAACKGKPHIAFDIALPSSLTDTTAWFEIAAYRDASCGAVAPMLANGVPDGSQIRVAFRRDDQTTPTIGDIPRGSYAFAAVAKDETCAILATGCVEADVGSTDSVLVQMSAVDTPTGACGQGAACQAGRCVPANDNADPSVGAGCSLELLGAGPLANPVAGAGTLVSAPAIAETPNGFVVVYREVDPNGTTAKVTILPLDRGGGALPPARPSLGDRCGTTTENDGMGLVMNGADGELMVARPSCASDKPSGIELLAFNSKPEITTQGQSHLLPLNTSQVTVSDSHVAALQGGTAMMTFLQDGVAHVATVTPNGVTPPFGTFGLTSGNTGAWIAATDKVLALVAAGPPSGAAPPPPSDAGDPDAGDGGGPTPDASTGEGTPGPTLRLVMVPANTALDQIAAPATPRAPIEMPGEWGAVAATGSRVIVMSDGSGPGRSVTYRTFDLNGAAAVETNGISLEGSGKATTGDLAIKGDRVFFASLKPGFIALHAFNGATTSPRPLHQVYFAKEPRIPAITFVRDGRVAVAVSDTRVAVAWTTAKILQANDTTGGYAVFACTQ